MPESVDDSSNVIGFSLNVELEAVPYERLINFGERISSFRRTYPEVVLRWYEADEQIKSEEGGPEPEDGEEDDCENDPNWYVVTLEFQSQADLNFFEANFWGKPS